MSLTSMHGGPDALGIPRWDFSTNANACGPEPTAWQAVQQADTTRYPDPGYAALRRRLSQWHGVEPQRIVLAASASEFIQRMSLAIAQRSPGAAVHLPSPGYGDYARAARAHGLEIVSTPCSAALVWHTEPGNPCGDSTALPEASRHAVVVVDRAYAGLRLDGEAPDWPGSAWQLWSPNKALGLTGVRAAYAVAPRHAESLCEHLERLAPSWPLGAHGVALLDAWVQAPTQAWLHGSLVRLRGWKAQQRCMLETLGWACRDSVVPFFVARWNADADPATLLPRLRDHGIKLRDARSLGLPGWVRLSVQAPEAQHALRVAWQQIGPR